MGDHKEELQSMNNIPQALRFIMIFIDRVGFPILAFIMMFIMAFLTIKENTTAINKFTASFETFSSQVLKDHSRMMETLKDCSDCKAYKNLGWRTQVGDQKREN